jgi:hyperosmotically inducible protein
LKGEEKIMRKSLTVITLAASLSLLGACSTTDTHKTVGQNIDDATITTKVKAELVGDSQTKARDIEVKTYRGVVQLSGFVDSAQEKAEAGRVARNVSGVQDVKNDLELQTRDRTVGAAVDDTVITTRVKTALVGNPVTKAREINVTTRNGVVMLSGFVDSREERSTAVDVARTVQGVQSVDDELQLKSAP